jgi:hypothetical protein
MVSVGPTSERRNDRVDAAPSSRRAVDHRARFVATPAEQRHDALDDPDHISASLNAMSVKSQLPGALDQTRDSPFTITSDTSSSFNTPGAGRSPRSR